MDQVQAIYDQLHADPNNWELRIQLIEMLVHQQQPDLAHQVLSEAPEIPEHSYEILAQWGMIEHPAQTQFAEPTGVPEPDFAQQEVYQEPAAEEFVNVEPIAEPTAEPEAVQPVIPVASLDRTSVRDLPKLAPLVDPDSVPEAPALNVGAQVAHEHHLNYTPNENLSQTRKHLAVYSGDGSPIDADLLSGGMLDYDEEEPVLMVAEGGYKPHAVRADDTKEKVGAILTTILVHAAIVVLLYFLVITIAPERPPEITAVTVPTSNQDQTMKRKLPRAVQKNPSAPANQAAAVVTAATTASVSVPTVDVAEVTDSVDFGTSFGSGFGGFGAGPGGGGFSVPGAMKSRCTTAERARMRAKHGGKNSGDTKIKKALKFLKEAQNEDGSWGDGEYNAAMTGLALLSYLGYCVTPDDPEYGETVMKGIMYLVEFYQNDKKLYATSTNHGASYEHGIATYALGETYAIARLGKTKLPGMKDAFEHGVQVIIDGQNPDGGWSYGYPARGNSDTSVTGWQYQALKAAMHTKINITGLNKAIKNAQQYLDDIQDRNSGMFPYRPGQPGKATLTGAGVLGLQMLGGKDYKDEIEKGLEAIHNDIKGKAWANANLYMWYYNTQAAFEGGGKVWDDWNDMFQDEIIDNQNSDGSWSHGSARQGGGNIYATCLCTLMLEVYYRYLPAASKN